MQSKSKDVFSNSVFFHCLLCIVTFFAYWSLLSSLLAVIALQGMEKDWRHKAFQMRFGSSRANPGINIVSYVDDCIVTCKTKEQAEQFVPVIAQWLADNLDVELSLEKTQVTHINGSTSLDSTFTSTMASY